LKSTAAVAGCRGRQSPATVTRIGSRAAARRARTSSRARIGDRKGRAAVPSPYQSEPTRGSQSTKTSLSPGPGARPVAPPTLSRSAAAACAPPPDTTPPPRTASAVPITMPSTTTPEAAAACRRTSRPGRAFPELVASSHVPGAAAIAYRTGGRCAAAGPLACTALRPGPHPRRCSYFWTSWAAKKKNGNAKFER